MADCPAGTNHNIPECLGSEFYWNQCHNRWKHIHFPFPDRISDNSNDRIGLHRDYVPWHFHYCLNNCFRKFSPVLHQEKHGMDFNRVSRDIRSKYHTDCLYCPERILFWPRWRNGKGPCQYRMDRFFPVDDRILVLLFQPTGWGFRFSRLKRVSLKTRYNQTCDSPNFMVSISVNRVFGIVTGGKKN